MNTVNLIGRLVRDNELKYTKSGKAVATNTLALDDGWGDNKKSYFIPIVVWEKQAESLANYTNKGSKIAVNGKLTSRSYETQDGQKRTVIEVVANQYGGIEFLDTKTAVVAFQTTKRVIMPTHSKTATTRNQTHLVIRLSRSIVKIFHFER